MMYQVDLCLLKYTAFFCVSFCVQFLVLVSRDRSVRLSSSHLTSTFRLHRCLVHHRPSLDSRSQPCPSPSSDSYSVASAFATSHASAHTSSCSVSSVALAISSTRYAATRRVTSEMFADTL